MTGGHFLPALLAQIGDTLAARFDIYDGILIAILALAGTAALLGATRK